MKTLRFLWDHPLQRRVSLLTTVAVALTVVLCSGVGYFALRASLVNASQEVAASIAQDLSGPAARSIATTGTLSADLRQAGMVVVEAVDGQGRVLGIPGEARQLVVETRDLAATNPDASTLRRSGRISDGHRYVVVAVPLAGTGYALLVGRSLEPVLQVLEVQRLVLGGICLAGILAAAVAGVIVGASGLRPMRQLTEAMQHVTATQDFQPVSVRYAKGDLVTMAASFNLMLASLTKARERQSRLVADAGHELRTPLTSLRTNVDLLATDLRRDRLGVEQKEAVLGDVQGQLGELSEMISDLVHVARDDSALALAPLDVRDVVTSALERVQRRAQGVSFDVELQPFFVVANADSLRRAVTNLLDNAVKWSPPGSTVRVRLEGNRLRVSDAGPGIPDADLPYVFDRFFRGESGRKTKGTGLGLAIVAKTMDEIGGSVHAGRSAEGGAEFTLQLPGVTSREAVASLLVPSP
ncbi:ATP-binding protein [Microlunatus flavus]|uniref:histidine kinase n=1 Tax=Microlunatus flavus TaxID=1036181 RepID=A0A1H9H9Q7_9ACTN|nr:ATP-binding protein [Microlunatus flavus]SEQ59065.1 two-component system, OmpR family, sensor histidine kinase MprB [Microlunatus flavus]